MKRRVARGAILMATLLVAVRASAADTKTACIDAAEGAQKLRTTGHLTEARAQLLQCTRDACPKVVRDDCTSWIAEVDKEMPSLIVRARSPKGDDVDGAVVIDDKPARDHVDGTALAIDPGPHTVRIVPSDPAFAPADTKVIVAAGEKNRIVTLQVTGKTTASGGAASGGTQGPATGEAPKGSGTRWVGWTLGGLGVAGMIGFAVLEVVAQGEFSDMRASTCGQANTCGADVLDPIRTKFQASAVMLGVSGALLVSGVLWLILDRPSAPKTSAWLGVAPQPGGASVGLGGSF